jgi:hypothetical protein
MQEEVAIMLFAFFGLGIPEIIVLGLLCVVPIFAVTVVLVVLKMTKKRPPPRDERLFPDDDRDPE